jgi:hypothetical protein
VVEDDSLVCPLREMAVRNLGLNVETEGNSHPENIKSDSWSAFASSALNDRKGTMGVVRATKIIRRTLLRCVRRKPSVFQVPSDTAPIPNPSHPTKSSCLSIPSDMAR